MFEFEDNMSTGFHDVFLSKYAVSKFANCLIKRINVLITNKFQNEENKK